jgi:putative FmdB family regulatory protein
MPIYDFRCACGNVFTEYRTIDGRNCAPSCSCGGEVERVLSAPYIQPDIQPFKNVANKGEWITSRSHKREMLAKTGMVEVGDSGMS